MVSRAMIVYQDEVVETEYCERCNLHYPVGDRCNCPVILLPPSSLEVRAMEIAKPIRLRAVNPDSHLGAIRD